MRIPAATRTPHRIVWGAVCACCFAASGCSDPSTTAGIAHPSVSSASKAPMEAGVPHVVAREKSEDGRDAPTAASADAVEGTGEDFPITATAPSVQLASAQRDPPSLASKERSFAVEGSEGALRVGFDDLDLLKILKMDPVTPDCKEKMPGWLRKLEGRKVRIRGFMKPGLLLTDIPQFMFVRDTGLCCFGPKGKIYDMIAVTLKAGTTTDYIELRPFDVVGTFKIDVLQLDDGMIFGLYYIDDAAIVQK